MPLRRRKLLRTAAAVPVAATAGCTDRFRFGDDADVRDPPAYARWVPATSPGTEGTYFVYVDWTGPGDIETLGDIPGGDVLARVASLGLFLTGFSYSLLGSYVFEDVGGWTATDVEQPDSATGQDLGTIERSLLCGAAVILEGEFDLETVEAVAFDEGFERAGTQQETRVYEGSTIRTSPSRPGGTRWSSVPTMRYKTRTSRCARSSSGPSTSRPATGSGWQTGATMRSGPLAAPATAGSPSVPGASSRKTPRFNDLIETSRFGNAAGATAVPLPQPVGEVYSLALGEPAPSGDMAATYTDGNVPDRETVASTVGDRAHEQDVEVDDGRVSVSATWQLPTDTESSRRPRPRSHTGGQ